MKKELLMGNEAIALGAVRAGVNLACGYPGTPSTEILEALARIKPADIYVEWSVNEKAALEVAAGASFAGARTLVTMKQVGLNVASDPLMSLAYVGVKGGMVVVAADDPGPISSQTEQDTRTFARFSKLTVFDPGSPEDAYQMIQDAFALSEEYSMPVLLRPTTRVCHGCALINTGGERAVHKPEGFIKDTARWVIFPRSSYLNHLKIERRNIELSSVLSSYEKNRIEGSGDIAVAAGGISYAYVKEALESLRQKGLAADRIKLLKVSTPHPFPNDLALEFFSGIDEVMVFEELDPVIERALLELAGTSGLCVKIRGKMTGDIQNAGENSVNQIESVIASLLGHEEQRAEPEPSAAVPSLPVRPPVLCAGCPHRGAFYAVKQVCRNKKAVFSGDIGCYTLGNAAPLDMVDTCLCMGAGITIAQGINRTEQGCLNFAFVGDSTFFASGITGIVNAVYNSSDIIIVVLDNSTTAMTGHQTHPGMGRTLMGEAAPRIDIEAVLRAIGLQKVVKADPNDFEASKRAVEETIESDGVRAIIFESPCIAVTSAKKPFAIAKDKCIGCKKCILHLGCPAMYMKDGQAEIETGICFGCGLCAQICPAEAIR